MSGPSQAGGPGVHVPPHFLADQLTLSQPGGPHYPHLVLRDPPPDFQTLRRPCLYSRGFFGYQIEHFLILKFRASRNNVAVKFWLNYSGRMDSTKRATKLYIGFYRHSSTFGILISAIFYLMRFEITNSEISTFSTFAGHYQFHGVFFKDKTRKKTMHRMHVAQFSRIFKD